MNFVKPELPCDVTAEKLLLAILLSGDDNIIGEALETLSPKMFFDGLHSKIFEVISVLFKNSNPIQYSTVLDHLRRDRELDSTFDKVKMYLEDLFVSDAYFLKGGSIGQMSVIKEKYRLRELISLGKRMVEKASNPELEATSSSQILDHIRTLCDFSGVDSSCQQISTLSKNIIKILDSGEFKFDQAKTGFRDIDMLLGGFDPSDLIILAARPSMGKTALMLNFILNFFESCEDKEKTAVVFSLEMSSAQLLSRILSLRSGRSYKDLFRKQLPHAQLEELRSIHEGYLSKLPLFIDDSPSCSVDNIAIKAKLLSRDHKLGVIFIDYLQLLSGDGSKRSKDNRVLEVSYITQRLKAIAKELNVPVVALSQLSRSVESREDKRPQLSDLRDSGSIEQDADVVLFLYREEYYIARKKPLESERGFMDWQNKMSEVRDFAEVSIAKNRNGPIGNVKLIFTAECGTFKSLYHRSPQY